MTEMIPTTNPKKVSDGAGSLGAIYERLNDHAVQIAQLGSSMHNLEAGQRQIVDSIKELSSGTRPDYKWIWGALGVLVMIASGYTTLITTPMAARITMLEQKLEAQSENQQTRSLETLKGFAELSYRLGQLEAQRQQAQQPRQ